MLTPVKRRRCCSTARPLEVPPGPKPPPPPGPFCETVSIKWAGASPHMWIHFLFMQAVATQTQPESNSVSGGIGAAVGSQDGHQNQLATTGSTLASQTVRGGGGDAARGRGPV